MVRTIHANNVVYLNGTADLVMVRGTQSAIETFNESVDDKGLRVIIRKLYDFVK